ncbi:unnamed protein product [Vitrella brassicaformis CCMP3155]|uniref:Uncharacterized protein n=3 Tax=Vitrella brassicaformis TaxID=1169539 RepID=A0A0G4GWK2_VITBC|nr:unnamed protein product [Vitrella brassicaformis CCMP3155]|eukprot:CEM35356.1 unnamed protein product [Vitrella brassicaformis CCMP3155]
MQQASAKGKQKGRAARTNSGDPFVSLWGGSFEQLARVDQPSTMAPPQGDEGEDLDEDCDEPRPTSSKPPKKVPKSGFPGVSWNSRMASWLAFWTEPSGQRRSKTFNTKGQGVEAARLEAVEYLKLKKSLLAAAPRRRAVRPEEQEQLEGIEDAGEPPGDEYQHFTRSKGAGVPLPIRQEVPDIDALQPPIKRENKKNKRHKKREQFDFGCPDGEEDTTPFGLLGGGGGENEGRSSSSRGQPVDYFPYVREKYAYVYTEGSGRKRARDELEAGATDAPCKPLLGGTLLDHPPIFYPPIIQPTGVTMGTSLGGGGGGQTAAAQSLGGSRPVVEDCDAPEASSGAYGAAEMEPSVLFEQIVRGVVGGM